MRNVFRKLHLWLSVPFGVVIAITCFSGAMLVFEKEITAFCRSNITTVPVGGTPLPVGDIAARVAATLPDSVTVSGVVVSANPAEAYKVSLSKPKRAAIYVDQYTGEIKGRVERLPFFNTMFRLHRWLMDSAPKGGALFWGKMVVGTSTLLFVIILLTGIVLWWPRTKKAFKHRVRVVFTKGWHRFWYDLHVVGGFYALLFLLAMALTGLTWSFQWYRDGFYKIFGADTAQAATAPADKRGGRNGEGRSAKGGEHSPFAHWQQAFDNVAALNPRYSEITVSDGVVAVSERGCGNQRATDKYSFDRRTGNITKIELYKDARLQSKIRGWVYSVHVGSFGGPVTRVLAFLAALLGASLPLTGYYLWIKRLYRKKR